MRRQALTLALLAPLLLGASKPVLVPDVSARTIEIRYSFTGAQLLLFGAILYPGGRLPSEQAHIAIVVKGPVQPIVVREKQKIAGIWMNADSHRFQSAPSFYAIATSEPVAELVDERTAAIYELGLGNLQLSPGGGALPDVGLYCLNAARFLSGEEPVEVMGNTWSTPGDARFREVEESCQFVLRFPSGFIASCSTGYASHKSQMFRLNGSDAWAEMNPSRRRTRRLTTVANWSGARPTLRCSSLLRSSRP